MYKLCVPVMVTGRDKEDMLMLAEQLRVCKTDEIFIVFDRVLDSKTMLREKI